MSNIKTAIALIEAEAREGIKNAETIEGKFKAAFGVAKNHWMFTDEDIQYRSGIGVVMSSIEKDSKDYQRIESELNMLKTLSAAMSGVSVNFPESNDDFDAIGIQGIWEEA